jgi:hypothetical protein
MKKLDININKAQLVSFGVKINEEGVPAVDVTIALITEAGKVITTYNISTDAWSSESKFELPFEAAKPIMELVKLLEAVAVRHCREGQLTLAASI